jgi:hypothetical protein
MELVAYVVITLGATWVFERRLLREALGNVLGRPAAATAV